MRAMEGTKALQQDMLKEHFKSENENERPRLEHQELCIAPVVVLYIMP